MEPSLLFDGVVVAPRLNLSPCQRKLGGIRQLFALDGSCPALIFRLSESGLRDVTAARVRRVIRASRPVPACSLFAIQSLKFGE